MAVPGCSAPPWLWRQERLSTAATAPPPGGPGTPPDGARSGRPARAGHRVIRVTQRCFGPGFWLEPRCRHAKRTAPAPRVLGETRRDARLVGGCERSSRVAQDGHNLQVALVRRPQQERLAPLVPGVDVLALLQPRLDASHIPILSRVNLIAALRQCKVTTRATGAGAPGPRSWCVFGLSRDSDCRKHREACSFCSRQADGVGLPRGNGISTEA